MTTTTAPTIPTVADIVGPLPECERTRIQRLSDRTAGHAAKLTERISDIDLEVAELRIAVRSAVESDEPVDGQLRRAGQLAEERRQLVDAAALLRDVSNAINRDHIGTASDPVYVAWRRLQRDVGREYRRIEQSVAEQSDLDPVEAMELLEHRIGTLAARYTARADH
jgi:hypothetical protein